MSDLLHPYQMHEYQVRAVNHMLSHPSSMLWMGMGLGKTMVGETSVAHLIQHNFIRAALVTAPLRVVQAVWMQEARKWSHLRHLRFSLIHGNVHERIRALSKPADIYLINYENLAWLYGILYHYYISRGTLLPFDAWLIDESTKMKSADTKRFEAMLPLLPYFKYRTGLTGTPASNGLEDLWGQFLMVDSGQRLGADFDSYIFKFFEKGGYGGYKNKPTEEGEAYIHRIVSDIVLQLRSEDYIKMPDLKVNDIWVDLPPKARKQYDELELQMWTMLDNGEPLEIQHESAKVNKLLQMANGAAYTNTETKEWERIHDAKLDALEEVIEEAGGEPILLGYNYKPDAYRILKRFKFAKNLTGMKGSEFTQTLEDWKAGKVRLLLGHPASMGHGVDGLQKRGHILVKYGNNWSLELNLQLEGRLQRQGQGEPVICHRIMARDTADELVRMSLVVKDDTQTELRDAVDAYRRQRGMA